MKIGKSVKYVTWIFACMLTTAAFWSYFITYKIPIPGLERISGQEKIYSIPQAVIMLSIAIYMSFEQWQSRDKILVLQGITLCLWLGGMFYISMPFGIAAWVAFMGCRQAIQNAA